MLEMPDRSRLKVDAQSYKYTWQAMHTGHQRPPIGRFAAQESFGHRHRPAALQCGERSVRIGQKQSRNYFPRSGALYLDRDRRTGTRSTLLRPVEPDRRFSYSNRTAGHHVGAERAYARPLTVRNRCSDRPSGRYAGTLISIDDHYRHTNW